MLNQRLCICWYGTNFFSSHVSVIFHLFFGDFGLCFTFVNMYSMQCICNFLVFSFSVYSFLLLYHVVICCCGGLDCEERQLKFYISYPMITFHCTFLGTLKSTAKHTSSQSAMCSVFQFYALNTWLGSEKGNILAILALLPQTKLEIVLTPH